MQKGDKEKREDPEQPLSHVVQNQQHGHKDRIWDSKQTKSENLANMYLLAKDHKAELGWRKVVSGCDSDTLGLSNSVSELLEAVCNSLDEPYEVVSSEDMLACVVECNTKIEKIRKEKMEKGEPLGDQEELILMGTMLWACSPT